MIRVTQSIRFVLPVFIIFILFMNGSALSAQSIKVRPRLIEVFTSTGLPVTSEAAISRQPDYTDTQLHIYELDGIQSVEEKLSNDLPADFVLSKRIVLQHIEHFGNADRAQLQSAAMGLSKAMQYGIDRYPVVVLDGELALYGVTDLVDVLHRYQSWQEDEAR